MIFTEEGKPDNSVKKKFGKGTRADPEVVRGVTRPPPFLHNKNKISLSLLQALKFFSFDLRLDTIFTIFPSFMGFRSTDVPCNSHPLLEILDPPLGENTMSKLHLYDQPELRLNPGPQL